MEGRRLVALGRTQDGCAKLELSEGLDPAAGTQINLADCYEKLGKLASAWIEFHKASVTAQRLGRSEWAEQARERARVLEPSVPELTVVIDEPVAGLEIRRDGVPMEPSTFKWPVPVDPASYEISAVAPGMLAWSTRVAVDSAAHVILHVPRLIIRPSGDPLASAHPPDSVATSRPSAVGRTQRITGLALGVIGVAWLGVGAALGFTAIADNNRAGHLCPTSPRCTDLEAVTLTSDARRVADASTASFIAGGVFVATGALLYLTAPRGVARASVGIAAGGAQLTLATSW